MPVEASGNSTLRSLRLFPPPKSLGKSYDGHAISSRLRHNRLRSAKSRRLDPYVCLFVSSADMNLLLPIAPELRLAPLHALHDTSNESSATCGNWGKSERAPHKRYSNARNNYGCNIRPCNHRYTSNIYDATQVNPLSQQKPYIAYGAQ